MNDLEVLKQSNPELAEYLELWRSRHQKNFNFTEMEQQSEFHEAVLDMARHMAETSESGSLTLEVSNSGAAGLIIRVTPVCAS